MLAAAMMSVTNPLPAVAGEGWGDGDNSRQVDTDSELNDVGEMFGAVRVAADEAYVGGTPGTYTFPVNVTVYGKPIVVFPEDGTDWDAYCFRVVYSFAHVDEVDARQAAGNGSFELMQDRDYWEPASTAYQQELDAYEDALVRRAEVEAENELRVADGLEPLALPPVPARPEEPTFPLELCEGAPGEAPDLRPAFDAAAELLGSIDPPSPHIAPGVGVTGLEGYLETGRTMDVNQQQVALPLVGWDYSADPLDPTPIPGTGMFTGFGQYTVDWGDGTVTGPHRSGGIPYGATPSGEQVAVTHAYADAGDHDVVLTDEWWVEMEVSFLGETYTFVHHEVLAPHPPYRFPVQEVRSVRQR